MSATNFLLISALIGAALALAASLALWRRAAGRLQELSADAEAGRFEKVQSRLRWLGLSELWGALDRESGPAHFEERIVRFVQGESGFSGCALLSFNPASGELSGRWQKPQDPVARLEPVRWSLASCRGAVVRCLRDAEIQYSDAPGGEDLLRVGGQRPARIPSTQAYLVLPLLGHLSPPARTSPEWPRPPALGVLVLQTDLGLDLPREARRLAPLATMVGSLLEHRRLHQHSLSESRLRQTMLDAMWNGLVGTDSRGRILFSNQRAREMAQVGDWEGEPLDRYLELPAPDALSRCLLEQVPYSHADATLRRPSDPSDPESSPGRLPVRVALNPVLSDDGARAGVVCVFEDRSQVQALEAELRHLDTLAAMGRFASALAHEVRNPLGGIQAGISYLRRHPGAESEKQETLDVMEKEIRRVDSILQSLLSVARPQELRPHECELREMMERVKRSIQPLLDERSMHLNIEGGPAVVLADEGMIHQVLLNLVKNAVEASPERGLIRVFLEDAGPEDEARGLQVRVEDSGTGVDPEILPRLFEPFASRKAGGTGLGLYVCHNFVERHGGRLTAENLAAGGARFTLVLPQSPALIGG